MPSQAFYAYVDGSDLTELEDLLVDRLTDFVRSRTWTCGYVHLVNQKGDPNDPSLGPDDLPDWELGINFTMPNDAESQLNWIDDVEETMSFLAQLHTETGRDFVIGIGDAERGISQDLMFVSSGNPDTAALRRMIGVGSSSTGRRS